MIPFAFLPGITESWLILSSHFKTGREVVSNAGPSMKGQVIHPLGNPRLPTKPPDTLFPTDNRGALANTELLYKVVSECICTCVWLYVNAPICASEVHDFDNNKGYHQYCGENH